MELDTVDARVKKCKDISILMDKKMRQRRVETEKYIIELDYNNPFKADDYVKIVRREDFEKLKYALKLLRNERDRYRDKVKELEIKLKLQDEYIEKMEPQKGSENKKRLIKSLIN